MRNFLLFVLVVGVFYHVHLIVNDLLDVVAGMKVFQ